MNRKASEYLIRGRSKPAPRYNDSKERFTALRLALTTYRRRFRAIAREVGYREALKRVWADPYWGG